MSSSFVLFVKNHTLAIDKKFVDNYSLEKSEATLSVFSIPAIIVRKYTSKLDERKTVNSSHPPPSLFWRSMFFSAPLRKQKLINDLIYEVELRVR